MPLFELTYRRRPEGARHGLLSAPDLETAERVGQKWCELESAKHPNWQIAFVGVRSAVLADASILEPPKAKAPEPAAPAQAPNKLAAEPPSRISQLIHGKG